MGITQQQNIKNIGRFAPSPTGLMHFGSLVSAVASYCFAKARDGKWLIRMEDLDKPRNIPGAADAILRQLEYLGLYWDKTVVYQSSRMDFYAAALQHLVDMGHVYRCICTRREISAQALRHTSSGAVYSGRCRFMHHSPEKRGGWRLMVEDTDIAFYDLIFGHQIQNLSRDVGDYILKRTDNIFAYQFATPLDDAAQGITQVIRGADLLDSTPRQIYLLRLMDRPIPEFGHVPLVLNQQGEKISKSSQSLRSIDPQHPLPFGTADLFMALVFLGQTPPDELRYTKPVELVEWAVRNFSPTNIPLKNSSAS